MALTHDLMSLYYKWSLLW